MMMMMMMIIIIIIIVILIIDIALDILQWVFITAAVG